MKFTINGKEYESVKYSYNTHCAFDEMGVDVLTVREKPLSVCRAYFAICSGHDLETAGNELEAHITNGGDISEVLSSLVKEIEKSDFFRTLVGTKKRKKSEEPTKEGE